jgi:peptidyl-prolyl cis-trans isomerase A (cyclophilin A)
MFALFVLMLTIVSALGASGDMSSTHEMEVNAQVTHKVSCATTKGDLTIEVIGAWSPLGAARFVEMVQDNFYDEISLYRSVPNFLTQFGANNVPSKQKWNKQFPDDPSLDIPFRKGYMSFAGSGPNSRNSQVFITYADVDFLGNSPWETPFARVVLDSEGEAVLNGIYKGDDIPPFGNGPDQQRVFAEGNEYIKKNFPQVDYILHCDMLEGQIELIEQDHRRELLSSTEKRIEKKTRSQEVQRGTEENDIEHRIMEDPLHNPIEDDVTTNKEALERKKRSRRGWFSRQRHTMKEILKKGKEEELRRIEGEEVIEELTEEELALYLKETMNHHGPHENPPGEFLFVILFGVVVYNAWGYLKRRNAADIKRS